MPAMPVLDQVRNDGSGDRLRDTMKRHWIPGQARNDKTATSVALSITTQSLKGGETNFRTGKKMNFK